MMRARFAAAIAGCLLPCLPAAQAAGAEAGPAPDKPLVRPSRDVDITYAMVPQGQGQSMKQRMRWDVAEQRMRLDPPGQGMYAVIDYRARRMSLVRDADKTIAVVDAGSGLLPGEAPGGDFSKGGTAQVENTPCTEWDTRDNDGRKVTLCITDDGVMLRARSGPHVLAQAVQLGFGRQDAALFQLPAGYTQSAVPVVHPAPATTAAPAPAAPPVQGPVK